MQTIIIISQGLCHFVTKNLFLIDMTNLNFSKELDDSEREVAPKMRIKKIKINTSSNIPLSNNIQMRSDQNRYL